MGFNLLILLLSLLLLTLTCSTSPAVSLIRQLLFGLFVFSSWLGKIVSSHYKENAMVYLSVLERIAEKKEE